MFNAGFTDLLLLWLAAVLLVAAIIDVRTFTISNRLNLTVALGAPLYWLSIALVPFWLRTHSPTLYVPAVPGTTVADAA